ncbi:unnamed protein product [Urochloa humidicola]
MLRSIQDECSRSLFWQVIRRWDSTETITEIDRICNHSKWHQHIYKHVPTVDPFERRRQRDRDRYAQMPTQQKEELLKKHRENYQRNKVATIKLGVECHQLPG